MVKEVKKLGVGTCVTLGLLKDQQADMLKEAGLDFYNYNVYTSKEYYDKIITTCTFKDHLNTLKMYVVQESRSAVLVFLVLVKLMRIA
ncbi:MAG: hypothetical protein PV340_00250 [Wolbachia sp.]|nr:hypothetical protein [Wolbachia sp.]MDD9336688.1 hypothetical protein [Wolbachia sp.]